MNLLYKIIVILVCLSAVSRADTYRFANGETPAISIIDAAKVCERMSAEAGIGKFNPSAADLTGSKEPGAGSWVFKQFSKAGEEHVFVIYFPENMGYVIRVKDNSQIATFRIDGQKVLRLPDPDPDPRESDDPFEDEATPVDPRPGHDKNASPQPVPHQPTTRRAIRHPNPIHRYPKKDKVK